MSPPGEVPAGRAPHPLRSAAWVLVLAVLVSVALLVSILWRGLDRDRPARMGDGRDPATYGFDLGTDLIDAAEIVAGGLPRDGLPVLVLPPLLDPAGVDSLNAAERGKYLVPDDLVIGVVVGSAARAYPLRVLNWHEVASDTLGGQPILVTYSPLCDAAAVFTRRVGGRVREFGYSGLLYRSNLLVYDRAAGGEDPSLWCQLQARAVTGPAARDRLTLEPLPMAVTTWHDWRAGHPGTTVPLPAPAQRDRYKRDPYRSYFGTHRPRFPAPAVPADSPLRPMDRVLAVRLDGGWRVLPLVEEGGAGGGAHPRLWRLEEGGAILRLETGGRPPVAVARREDAGTPPPAMSAFWFAWHGLRAERPAAPPAGRGRR